MRPIEDKTIQELEELALEGAKQIRAFFTYEGSDLRYLQKAKLGAAAIGGYSRVRASETNRLAVELASARATDPARLTE